MAPTQHGYAPTLDSFLHAKLHLEAAIEQACSLLKRRQIRGPESCALVTAHVMSLVVSKAKWADVDQLLDRVCQAGRKLVDAQPQELVIGNIVRRVLGLIHDEVEADRTENGEDPSVAGSMSGSISDLRADSVQPGQVPSIVASPSYTALARTTRQPSLIVTGPYQSMFNLLSAVEPASVTASGEVSSAGSGASTPVPGGPTHGGKGESSRTAALRDEILDGIEEIKDEIGQADDQIAGFAESQIRPGDTVMVYAEPSRTIEKFLIKAAARRRYTLYLVGATAPPTSGISSLYKRLGAAKCPIVHLSSTAVSAYMSRVNRVVIDARAIAANGGILAGAGSLRLARAARAQRRTVLVVGGVYKLSPEALTNPDAFVEWGEPGQLARFADGSLVGDGGLAIETAVTEFLPASLIDIYVTNLGPHTKDYLESVIADHYKREELELYKQ
ncbi:translation initiation factor eIF-2B subunit beta [Sporothrix schenckii 1099-18]|uniref:Translation initiation factor eIF2B subunit beta n=1 Tax=Sporothrix schenckii 1099-18 TaxID=1397361 RepID=A0A0F2MH98_SPOSC|nr:translation initiation factor eIF-2B subunit beta [Sporothrix schenckii 1099-18]KJR89068.1 translation initiation factor eIF-2B subunit beta [Sporothrix schenckii 1099-18]